MTKYEVLYILSSGLDEAAINAQTEKFAELVKTSGGEVESVNKWGLKKLAYPVNYKTEGYYVLMNFAIDDNLFTKELERQMRIADEVVRFLVTRKG
ncbi:MAG: 30S ribosomal protein S6 [Clostridia bacterium]|nr:30S ribosomal protein S6 [Clostridia bacterium]